jgi:hypothetical protein
MAFVTGYEHDVFISYAHIDNEPSAGADKGWVTLLYQELRKNLAAKLGTRALDIWMDPRLSPNVGLGDELGQRLQRTAVLLIVLSPAYRSSDWCQEERRIFLDLVGSRTYGLSSVFVVEKDRVAERPPELSQLGIGVRFWKQDDDDEEITHTFGWPEPDKDDQPYWDMIVKLATKLEKHLRQHSPRDAGRIVAPPRPVTDAAPVFVAHASDVLFDERQQVINYFEQAGLTVRPEGEYGADPESVTQLTKQHLSGCRVFAQLLSAKPGRRGPDFPLGFAGLQYELARAAQVKILQWRDPSIDLSAISDGAYRALLDGPTVMACGLEEFKAAVVAEAKRDDVGARPADDRSVVISAVKEDAHVADELQTWLLDQQIGVMKWVDRQSTESLNTGDGNLKRFADSLKASDAFIVVCGPGADPSWLTRKVKDGRRYGAQRQPAVSVALYDRRSPDDNLEIALPGTRHLDCRSGFNEAQLRQLLSRVEG